VYQIAGTLLPHPTVVVSPLIALQHDQVSTIASSRLEQAGAANATLSDGARRAVFDDFRSGALEFLFVTPEQLSRPETVKAIRAGRPSLFVVDEAHCISEWGHDFRPDYLRLASAIDALGRPPVLAMTATASPVVRDEIALRLRLRDPAVIVQGFDRPNIRFVVQTILDPAVKEARLIELMARSPGPAIVYVATRRCAEQLASRIEEAGIPACAYHGGMRKSQREREQERYMAGGAQVMVATNAFGLGIDKPDVRMVLHFDVPDSLDAYYQEAGRAGRDGDPALALLFWRAEDLGRRRFLAAPGTVDPAAVLRAASCVAGARRPVALAAVAAELDVGKAALGRLVGRLEEVGAVELDPTAATASWRRDGPDPEEAAARVARADERRRMVAESRLTMMRTYAESHDCRRRFILNYFGEDAAAFCGNCDSCDRREHAAPDAGRHATGSAVDDPFPEHVRVEHDDFGCGLVVRRDDDRVVVLFDEAGYKTLALEAVLETEVLRRRD
jgi:ATP-dependent DNA helicase RecQ